MVKDNASWENIAYWVTFGIFVSDVDDLGGNKARSSTSYE